MNETKSPRNYTLLVFSHRGLFLFCVFPGFSRSFSGETNRVFFSRGPTKLHLSRTATKAGIFCQTMMFSHPNKWFSCLNLKQTITTETNSCSGTTFTYFLSVILQKRTHPANIHWAGHKIYLQRLIIIKPVGFILKQTRLPLELRPGSTVRFLSGSEIKKRSV